MKITDIRTMRLEGPRIHDMGGGKGATISKVIVRVDTDAGIHGLGEVDHFAGVPRIIDYMREYFRGRDPLAANAIVSELLYGTMPPHHPEAKRGALAGGLRAVTVCSPTATATGPVAWAAGGTATRSASTSTAAPPPTPPSWRPGGGWDWRRQRRASARSSSTSTSWRPSGPAMCGTARSTGARSAASSNASARCAGRADSCAQVRAKSPIAICVGEMFLAEQFASFIAQEAVDILHPDVLFCGGLHEIRRIADYAEVNDLPVAFHGNGGALATIAAAHAAAACRNFLGLEYHFIETDWIGSYVERDAPLFRHGHLPLTDAPGFGVRLNRKVCQKYLAPGEKLLA